MKEVKYDFRLFPFTMVCSRLLTALVRVRSAVCSTDECCVCDSLWSRDVVAWPSSIWFLDWEYG